MASTARALAAPAGAPAACCPAARSRCAAALWMHAAPADQLARTLPTEDAYYVARRRPPRGASGTASPPTGGSTRTASSRCGRRSTSRCTRSPAATGSPACGSRSCSPRPLWLAFLALLALQARELARRHGGETGRIAAAAALILAGGAVSMFRLFHNGLETGLTLVLLAGAVLLLDRWEHWTPRRVLLAGVLLGLLAWARRRGRVRDGVRRRVGRPRVARRAAAERARAAGRRARSPPSCCPRGSPTTSRSTARRCRAAARPRARASTSPTTSTRRCAPAGAWSVAAACCARACTSRRCRCPRCSPCSRCCSSPRRPCSVRRRAKRAARPGHDRADRLRAASGVFYIARFGPWWFMERYLAPLLLLTIPWLATALELRRPSPARARRRWRRSCWSPTSRSSPCWRRATRTRRRGRRATPTSARTPTSTSPSSSRGSTTTCSPGCVVGAYETGTLLYFRDRTVNLDGKVDHDALEARAGRPLPDYVDARGVDVMVDIESGPPRGLRARRRFHRSRTWAATRPGCAMGATRCLPDRVGDTTMTPTRRLADAQVFPIGLGGMPMSLSSRPPEEQSHAHHPRRARRRRELHRHRRRLLGRTPTTSATTSG